MPQLIEPFFDGLELIVPGFQVALRCVPFQQTDIIMLTVYNEWQKIFDSLRAVASGYLTKNTSLTEIKKAIETVRDGGSVMSPEIARQVMEHFSAPINTERKECEECILTPKEERS